MTKMGDDRQSTLSIYSMLTIFIRYHICATKTMLKCNLRILHIGRLMSGKARQQRDWIRLTHPIRFHLSWLTIKSTTAPRIDSQRVIGMGECK